MTMPASFLPSSLSAALEGLAASTVAQPGTLLGIARTLQALGNCERARELAQQALSEASEDPEIQMLATHIMSREVPAWHFSIVNDHARNDFYERALRSAMRPGMRVLEIGCGTGLLAMMAVRAGAAEVITCEMNLAVADAAKRVIARNGYADRIRVIAKHSSKLDVNADLGGPADLLVSEIVSNDLLRESVLPTHEHAVPNLLKPGAQVIPARGIVRVALAEDRNWTKKRMGTVAGFDLTPFNLLAPSEYPVAVGHERLVLKSPPSDILAFDLQAGGPFPPRLSTTTTCAQDGGANGIVQWIKLSMDESIYFENLPTPGATSSWAALFHPFPETFRPLPGEPVPINCRHDRVGLRLWASPTAAASAALTHPASQ